MGSEQNHPQAPSSHKNTGRYRFFYDAEAFLKRVGNLVSLLNESIPTNPFNSYGNLH